MLLVSHINYYSISYPEVRHDKFIIQKMNLSEHLYVSFSLTRLEGQAKMVPVIPIPVPTFSSAPKKIIFYENSNTTQVTDCVHELKMKKLEVFMFC